MDELQVYSNTEFGEVRTIVIDGTPWFVGKDVATALGYSQPTKAAREKTDDEDKGMSKIDTPRGTQNTLIINESGLYSLILSSKLPSAKRFKRWVTNEVLPAIRRTGEYKPATLPETPRRALTPDDYFRAASIVAGCRNERLPVVLTLLRTAGVEIEGFTQDGRMRLEDGRTVTVYRPLKQRGCMAGEPHLTPEELQQMQALIDEALTRPGITISIIAKTAGLAHSQVQRVHKGQSSLTRNAILIEEAIKALCPDLCNS